MGSKNRFFDNRVQLNVEGFYWRYNDQQVSHTTTDSQGNTVFATENVGRATFKGVEAELQVRPLVNTSLNADVQYLSAKYDSFTYTEPNNNGGVSNGTACPNSGVTATRYTVNCSGFRPPNTPEWTINLGAQQTVPMSADSRLIGSARTHYQSRTLTGQEFTAAEYQSGCWTVDADLSLHLRNDRFTIGAFVNNLTNKTISSLVYPVPLTFYYVYNLRPPRTFGLRAGAKF